MKKILFNLLGLAAIATAISSCRPMDKTYKALDGLPGTAKTLAYTIQAADYTNTNVYPSSSAVYKAKGFVSTADANANVPALLNFKFFDYPDGSNANITFTPLTGSVVLADSVFKDVSYTLTHDDYLLLPGNKYADFSIAQVLSWLPYKYTAPAANQLAVLSWTFYPTINTTPTVYPGIYVSTTAGVTTATGSFLYLNGAWVQAYQITPAQYAAVGRGQYNQFTAADDASLLSYLNNLLKTDPYVAGNAKAGSVQYVSFNYYSSTKVTSQRVIQLTFDGTNWTRASAATTLTFVKSKGTWIPDPTVYYTTKASDYTLIGNSTIGTADGRSNYAQYGDFNIQQGSQYFWTEADIESALVLMLKTDFPNATVGIPYKITYLIYTGATTSTTLTFKFDGTNWAKQ
ncbi:hypothetical protein KXD93_05915 [Mucilaginibacter sp. BJC16-A38]|uniref:hypothetical protein n=1 Tax=Mucilaginibacter phenanthrenivorans TaxID=1234842 RepID=UPI0021587B53|nr:hypothetical protein [Mucilaginibacter phenanthrenivorans]MCR8557167.1 hypothetical protein [Mucilaginibacter phenanthrenivorans]